MFQYGVRHLGQVFGNCGRLGYHSLPHRRHFCSSIVMQNYIHRSKGMSIPLCIILTLYIIPLALPRMLSGASAAFVYPWNPLVSPASSPGPLPGPVQPWSARSYAGSPSGLPSQLRHTRVPPTRQVPPSNSPDTRAPCSGLIKRTPQEESGRIE